ncbi:hypothetical protein SteCoe_3067 [Stentor coeruleus]|uniref:Uncharacterized protein n=1 Tax=Stentor coeruleus TaxID=5963 RepID=A0A1R2CXZ5_9CILI|nr:hypothetical protein SteCoe_3067 [Stentor coeruleus]
MGFRTVRPASFTSTYKEPLLGTKSDLILPIPYTESLSPEDILEIEMKNIVGDLYGHQGSVEAVELTYDNKYIISGSSDRSILIWSVLFKRPIGMLLGHSDEVICLALTSDYSKILSGSLDKTAKLWNFETRMEISTFFGHSEQINSVLFVESKELVLTGSKDKSIKIWRYSGFIVATLVGHLKPVNCCAAIGNYIISCSDDKTLKLWDIENMSFGRNITTGFDKIVSCAASSDGRRFAFAETHNRIQVWDTITMQPIFDLNDRKLIVCIKFTGDSKSLISCSDDYYIYIWNLDLRVRDFAIRFFPKKPTAFSVNYNGTLIITGLGDKSIKIWSSDERRDEYTLHGHNDEIRQIACSNTGKLLVSGGLDEKVVLWDLENKKEDFTYKSSEDEKSYANVIGKYDGNIISGHSDGFIKFWDVVNCEMIGSVKGHMKSVYSIAINEEMYIAASGSEDKRIIIWNLISKEKDFVLSTLTHRAFGMVFVKNGEKLVSGGDDNCIRIWNLKLKTEEFIISGKVGCVLCLSLIYDGEFLVSGSKDGLVRIWNLETRGKKFTFAGHAGEVFKVVFLPNSEYLASASADCTVKIWNLTTYKEAFTLNGHKNAVRSLALVHGEKYLISSSDDCTIIIWNIDKREIDSILSGHIQPIKDLCYISDHLLISCSEDKTIRQWDIQTKKQVSLLCFKLGKILSIALAKNQKFIVCGTNLSSIFILNSQKKNVECDLLGHKKPVYCVDISSNCRKIASGSEDTTIKIWNYGQFKEDFTLEGHSGTVRSVNFTEDNRFLISGSNDRTIKIWNLDLKRIEYTFTSHSSSVTCVKLNANQNLIFSASEDKNVKVLNVFDKKLEYTTPTAISDIYSLALSADEKLLAYAVYQEIYVFNTESKKVEYRLQGHARNYIYGVLFTPGSRKIISCSADTSIKIWNLQAKCNKKTILWEDDTTLSMEITKDKKKLLCGLATGEIKIWNVDTKTLYYSSFDHISDVLSVTISDNDIYGASGSKDQSIKLWNIPQRKFLFTFKSHTDSVLALKFIKNNTKLVSASSDKTIKVFNLWTLTEEITLHGHLGSVNSLCRYKNDQMIITGSNDKTIVFWDFKKKAFDLTGHTDGVLYLTCENEKLYSSSSDKTIIIWDIIKKSALAVLSGHSHSVTSLIIFGENKLISSSYDKTVRIWDLVEMKDVHTFISHNDAALCLVRINKENVASCSLDKTIRVLNISQQCESTIFKGCSNNIKNILLTDKYLFTATEGSFINCYNIDGSMEEATLFGHSGKVRCLAYLEGAAMLISGSEDSTIKLWSLMAKRVIATLKEHTNWVRCIEVSSDQKYLISGSGDNTIKIWNLNRKSVESTLRGHKRDVNSVKLSSNNQYIISSSLDFTIKIWNFNQKTEISTISAHSNWVVCILFIQNERWIASGSADQSIKLWDFEQRREICTLIGHTSEVSRLIESFDQRYLISGSKDMTIKLWSIKERKLEFTLHGHTGMIYGLQLNKTGKQLYSCSIDQVVQVWELSGTEIKEEQTHPICNYKYKIKCSSTSFGDITENIIIKNPNDIEMACQENHMLTSEWSPSSSFDSYCHVASVFYNVIDSIKEDSFSYMVPSANSVLISKFKFTLAHIFAFTGKSDLLRAFSIVREFITSDVFGRSPIYYAAKKKHQKCVDAIVEYFIKLFDDPTSAVLHTSLFSIQNDFAILLRNSPLRLGELLKLSLISSTPYFASVTFKLPYIKFNTYFTPHVVDFQKEISSIEMIPIYYKYSLFELPYGPGSEKCIELLESVLYCKDTTIFKSTLIQEFINYQWSSITFWIVLYSIMYFLNLVLLLCLFQFKSNTYIFVFFAAINAMLLLWECAQLMTSGLSYFYDIWNYIDICRLTFTCLCVLTIDTDYNYLEEIAIFLNFIRGLTAFRMFDGTRYYIKLIFRSLNDVKYFLLMFTYSNLMFGALYSVKEKDRLTFTSLWLDIYSLNFGLYDLDQNGSSIGIGIFMMATIINVIVMLNLLISILGDSHDQFQIERTIVDYQEKAEMCLELQSLFFWSRSKSKTGYLHIMKQVGQDKNDVTWEGRMIFLERQIERFNENMVVLQRKLYGDISEKITSSKLGMEKVIVPEMKNNILKSDERIESKIEEVQRCLEEKIKEANDVSTDLIDYKLKEVQEINALLIESKLEDVHESIHEFDRKISQVENNLNNRLSNIESGIAQLVAKLNR